MRVVTIIKKIEKENGCSIATAELLTRALHREKRLDNDLAVRFRPLFGDFDIVNISWFNDWRITRVDNEDYRYIGTINNLKKFFNI